MKEIRTYIHYSKTDFAIPLAYKKLYADVLILITIRQRTYNPRIHRNSVKMCETQEGLTCNIFRGEREQAGGVQYVFDETIWFTLNALRILTFVFSVIYIAAD